MAKAIDIIGQRFGVFTVIERDWEHKKKHNTDSARAYWKCRCDQGHEISISGTKLREGKRISCKYCDEIVHDLKGKAFGYLIALEPTDKRIGRFIIWKCRCKCDGKIIEVSSANLVSGHTRSCGCLGSSAGEANIQSLLDKEGINYEKEKRFCDFHYDNGQQPRYDFYLPDQNRLIEYDGIQHFEPVEHFGGFEQFQKQQITDKIKNEYAKVNNIDLVRIPYWEKDNITLEMLLGDKYLVK